MRRPAETREEMLAAIAEAQRLDWDGAYLEGEDDLAEAAEEAEEYLAEMLRRERAQDRESGR